MCSDRVFLGGSMWVAASRRANKTPALFIPIDPGLSIQCYIDRYCASAAAVDTAAAAACSSTQVFTVRLCDASHM